MDAGKRARAPFWDTNEAAAGQEMTGETRAVLRIAPAIRIRTPARDGQRVQGHASLLRATDRGWNPHYDAITATVLAPRSPTR